MKRPVISPLFESDMRVRVQTRPRKVRHEGGRFRHIACLLLVLLGMSSSACTHFGGPTQPPAETAVAEPTLPPLSEAAQKRAEALARYSEGLALEQRRDIPGALSNYMVAAELDPDNESLQIRIAVLLIQQKRTSEAVAILEKLASKPQTSERPLMMLAMVYEGTGEYANAERTYEKLLALYPDRQEAYANLARLYLKMEQLDSAIQVLEQAMLQLKDADELLVLLAAAQMMRAQANPQESQHLYEAIRALERLAEKHPEDWRIQLQIADLYLRVGDYKKALHAFEAVEKAAGDTGDIKSRLAGLMVKDRDPQVVLQKLEEIAKTDPQPERVYYYMGFVSEAAQKADLAEQYYRRAIEGEHPQVGAIVSLAVLQATNLSASTETIRRGLEKFPEHPMLLNVMASIYFLQTNYADAAEYFRRAEKQSGPRDQPIRNANFFFSYAITLLNLGDVDGAAEQLQKAAQLNPAALESFLQNAFRQTEAALQKKYVEVLEKLGNAMSGEPDVYLYLGVLNSYLGFYQEALRTFERVERMLQEARPEDARLNAQFYFWYGSAAERSGDFERAEKLFLKCIELDPKHAEALNYLAYMWAERGIQLDRALEFVQRALEIQPASGAFVDTLGWIYYMQGNYTQALVEINRAAELIPEDSTILEHLGDVFEKLGDEEQAMPHWKRSFVLNPDNQKLAEKLQQRGVDLEPLRQQAEELKQKKAGSPPQNTNASPAAPSPTLLSPLPVSLSPMPADTLDESLDDSDLEEPVAPPEDIQTP